MRPDPGFARDERGFSLIELLVGIFLLLVGILGVMTMADMGSKNMREANAQIAATNLTREVAEHARSVDYPKLVSSLLVTELQGKPGLGGTGNPWTVERRNVTYTVAIGVCSFDDPRDGLAAADKAPANPCPTNGTGPSTSTERNGDDFRRVDMRVTWVRDGRPRRLDQTEMVVNPAGSLGPRITAFDDPVGQVTSGSAVTLPITTTDAAAVRWTVESVDAGDATGGRLNWTISWNLGSDRTVRPYVYDGVYTLAAQAFDQQIAGDARFVTVAVNRNLPFPVDGFLGGRNERHGGMVDVRWSPSVEPDVRKYRLYRVSSSGARDLICERTTRQRLACHDAAPPAGDLRYELVGIDFADLAAAVSAERESDTPAVLLLGSTPGALTPTPDSLTASVVNGTPIFDWSQTDIGNVTFWRVYRRVGEHTGPPTLADRHVTTSINHFEDVAPVSGPVTYWFSSVHRSYNESLPTAPVVVVS